MFVTKIISLLYSIGLCGFFFLMMKIYLLYKNGNSFGKKDVTLKMQKGVPMVVQRK